jgi:hypothetical protein
VWSGRCLLERQTRALATRIRCSSHTCASHTMAIPHLCLAYDVHSLHQPATCHSLHQPLTSKANRTTPPRTPTNRRLEIWDSR